MFICLLNNFFLYYVFVILFPLSLCVDNSETGPAVAGVYDTQNNQRILNYKGSNTLRCNITGTKKPEDFYIQWQSNTHPKIDPKSDDPHFEIKGNDLILKGINDDIIKDQYTCSLVSKANKGTTYSSAVFHLMGKPTAKIVSQGTFIQGQKILLECQVQGYPKPHIEWRYGNNTFGNDHDRLKLKDNIEKGLVNYYLEIEEAELSDRGEYACKAQNTVNEFINSTEAVIFVRVKDKFAALWPFIGICAEVVVLCAIIFVYERKRNKAELDESDTDQSPEQKNTPDHGKESVRQRK